MALPTAANTVPIATRRFSASRSACGLSTTNRYKANPLMSNGKSRRKHRGASMYPQPLRQHVRKARPALDLRRGKEEQNVESARNGERGGGSRCRARHGRHEAEAVDVDDRGRHAEGGRARPRPVQ